MKFIYQPHLYASGLVIFVVVIVACLGFPETCWNNVERETQLAARYRYSPRLSFMFMKLPQLQASTQWKASSSRSNHEPIGHSNDPLSRAKRKDDMPNRDPNTSNSRIMMPRQNGSNKRNHEDTEDDETEGRNDQWTPKKPKLEDVNNHPELALKNYEDWTYNRVDVVARLGPHQDFDDWALERCAFSSFLRDAIEKGLVWSSATFWAGKYDYPSTKDLTIDGLLDESSGLWWGTAVGGFEITPLDWKIPKNVGTIAYLKDPTVNGKLHRPAPSEVEWLANQLYRPIYRLLCSVLWGVYKNIKGFPPYDGDGKTGDAKHLRFWEILLVKDSNEAFGGYMNSEPLLYSAYCNSGGLVLSHQGSLENSAKENYYFIRATWRQCNILAGVIGAIPPAWIGYKDLKPETEEVLLEARRILHPDFDPDSFAGPDGPDIKGVTYLPPFFIWKT